jgi:hypothetical protein
MSDLNNDLSHFARTIVCGEAPSSTIDSHYSNYPLATAVEVYRNNYRGNLHDALAGGYPVIKKLVGDDFFRFLAFKFIEQYPSKSANLHHYGAELADFVADFRPAQELAYLSDVAALEWACHVAYFAKDAAPLDLCQLAQIPSEKHPYLIFRVHPAARVIRSSYPINAIWQAHQADADDDFHIDLDSGLCIALVTRKEDRVEVIELSEVEAIWLQLIEAENPLGTATITTLERYPDFDLQTTLLKLVMQNVLIDLR